MCPSVECHIAPKFHLKQLNNGLHDAGQVLGLDAGHVPADVEADDRLVPHDAVHDPAHLSVDGVLAQVEPRTETLDFHYKAQLSFYRVRARK